MWKKDSPCWLYYIILFDAGIDPFNNPAVQADFACHQPNIVARRTADTSAHLPTDSLRNCYASCTTLPTAGLVHCQNQPANSSTVLPSLAQQPVTYTDAPLNPV
ncbi:hypothetical protein DSO57_1009784 [Entomophthora muscae]|uniref:Uncharacterized protein n=1 Tax=Entomophthora muscae TaxID=34485 RepID=A0ACC2S8S9_9FUNG|nr:hypothetical protein DSO57_1009784 [Entomophthora muscae]